MRCFGDDEPDEVPRISGKSDAEAYGLNHLELSFKKASVIVQGSRLLLITYRPISGEKAGL